MQNVDDDIKQQLEACISEETRNSFFLFAGAGSGKTYSLVELLKRIKSKWGDKLARESRQVAVITYTNAATDEIKSRGNFGLLFHISTIHSFLWDVIQPYQKEIKRLYLGYWDEEISALTEKKESIKKKDGKTYLGVVEKLREYEDCKKEKEKIDMFSYDPNGNNLKTNSLNHQDILKIGFDLISQNRLFRKILSQQYPFMLIDESQDTNRKLVEAFFMIQRDFPENFTLGFIGDIKQRIYMDGKENMKASIPEGWLQPQKRMNYRCDKRIVELANQIAKGIDGSEQVSRDDAAEGVVHLFLASADADKQATERFVCEQMKNFAHDEKWEMEADEVKVLTLEHRMAATRLGFVRFHDLFNGCDRYKMSYLQGQMPEMAVFTKAVFPLLDSLREGKNAETLELFKRNSPLMEAVQDADYVERLRDIKSKIEVLKKYDLKETTVRECVTYVNESKLFVVPPLICDALSSLEEEEDKAVEVWKKAMDLPLSELKVYDDYVNDRTVYATHQGVKGLEYPRVLVLIDDKDAKGKLFSYERLFEVKPLSDTDIKNGQVGKETSIDRTMRLLYVTCTRAQHSLALLMYTSDLEKAKETAIAKNWFKDEEITILD